MVHSYRIVVDLLPRYFRSRLTIFCNCICIFLTFCWPCNSCLFISVINQLDAQNFCFTVSLFHASTCFEHVLIIRRSKLHYTASGIITPIDVMIHALETFRGMKWTYCKTKILCNKLVNYLVNVFAKSGIVRMLQSLYLTLCSYVISLITFFQSAYVVFLFSTNCLSPIFQVHCTEWCRFTRPTHFCTKVQWWWRRKYTIHMLVSLS